MVLTSVIYIGIGVLGYWHYGEETQASLTLNLPIDQM
jgi:amino acid permease